jgi:uroporphyrin-III C-methyltransferase
MKSGSVSIVGAGPGDPALLTVRAVKRIREAQVILHDSLVSSEVLSLAAEAEILHVGRRHRDSRDQTERQQQIHKLMLEHARAGRRVVRLKSGDPLIYGRTAEDVRFLHAAGIDFEVVPGISAGMGAASLLNIPITERYKSRAVLICTGHTATYDTTQLELLGRILSEGTPLMMYMGASSIEKIVTAFSKFCDSQEVWVTAVSNVSMRGERWVAAKLTDIQQRLQQAALPLPIILIFGRYAYPLSMSQMENARTRDREQEST